MSEQPITHCEHGIDRAYRCIDCIEAERDALRAWVEKLEIEREAQRSCAIYWMDQENALRASIVALADEWDAIAKRQRDQADNHDEQGDIHDATAKHGRASGYETCARELRQLAEGNSAAAQEGL